MLPGWQPMHGVRCLLADFEDVLEMLRLEALIGNLGSDDLRRVNAWLN